jgi:hypothetical protein
MHDVSSSSATDAVLKATTGRGGRAKTFEPEAVRYIKLGEKGKWAASAIEQGIIPFGYPAVDHQACLAGDWDRVRDQLVDGSNRERSEPSLRELKEFIICPTIPSGSRWPTDIGGLAIGPWSSLSEGIQRTSLLSSSPGRLVQGKPEQRAA